MTKVEWSVGGCNIQERCAYALCRVERAHHAWRDALRLADTRKQEYIDAKAEYTRLLSEKARINEYEATIRKDDCAT